MFDDMTVARFWSKVDKREPDECWHWLGAPDRKGYGSIRVGGRTIKAHRLAWAIDNEQEWPEPLVARHTCDNPGCVNPRHLIPGTPTQNVSDMWERDRQGGAAARNALKDACVRGHSLRDGNVRIRHKRDGVERVCRLCHRENQAASKARIRSSKAARTAPPAEEKA